MAAYLDDGRLIDGIIALLALEALALVAVRAFLGRGPSVVSLDRQLRGGGALFLALRAAMAEAPFAVIGGCLLAALVAHVADLATRWRGSPPPSTSLVPPRLLTRRGFHRDGSGEFPCLTVAPRFSIKSPRRRTCAAWTRRSCKHSPTNCDRR